MRVLILGGDGFIGSHLRNMHIALDDEVMVVDHNTLRSNPGSEEYNFYLMKVEKFFKEYNVGPVDVIYNCVAIATPDYYIKNPAGTLDLDFSLNKYIIDHISHVYPTAKKIHFSSSEVYGKTWTEPYTEQSNCVFGPADKTRWIYATSKLLLDQYILGEELGWCIIRPFNFCGEDIDWLPAMNTNDNYWKPRLPACFLNCLLTDMPLVVVEPGTQKRCYTYIDDATQGILSIIDAWDNCEGEIINLGNKNNETTIDNMADLFIKKYEEITGKKTSGKITMPPNLFYGPTYEDSERRLFSDEKMVRLTGWEPKIDLEETVEITIKNALEIYK